MSSKKKLVLPTEIQTIIIELYAGNNFGRWSQIALVSKFWYNQHNLRTAGQQNLIQMHRDAYNLAKTQKAQKKKKRKAAITKMVFGGIGMAVVSPLIVSGAVVGCCVGVCGASLLGCICCIFLPIKQVFNGVVGCSLVLGYCGGWLGTWKLYQQGRRKYHALK